MNLKAILSFILAGFLGGLICLGAIHVTENELFPKTGLANVSTSVPNPVIGPDFAMAAEIAQQAVVLIAASESEERAQNRKDPFEDWLKQFGFDNHPFGFDFGYGPRIRRGAGSGVIFSKDGYILTNNHVIDFADEVNVKTSDGKEYKAVIV